MARQLVEKKELSAKGFLANVREVFGKVSEPARGTQGQPKCISISDCLMSALAIFKLKFASLLQFDDQKCEEPVKSNLENLFGLQNVPCDTYMRERLDEVQPSEIRDSFSKVFALLQRGKVLEKYSFLDGKYLLLSDGTGYFSSKKVHCKNCCQKKHKDGSITYYHQLMGAAIAHPDYSEVIPICPEPIVKSDGATKNDCERNASERMLRDFRREHPHLPVIVVEDGLSSNGPHVKLLKELGMSFITSVKPDGNTSLFDYVNTFDWSVSGRRDDSQGEHTFIDQEGVTHKLRWVNGAPLNDSHPDIKVNFLEYWVYDPKKDKPYHNTWITDLVITKINVHQLARGGRARWHIENETFNTLKNQGYHFEHNFGHGNKNLSTVFAMLLMLAFLIDQAEQLCCGLFQGALKQLKSKKSRLWRSIREFFMVYIIPSWEVLYRVIIAGNERDIPQLALKPP